MFKPVIIWLRVGLDGGSGNRLVLQLNPGATLAPDDYRIYLPNALEPGGVDTRIFDIYGTREEAVRAFQRQFV